jgi:ribosome-binding factor A
MREPSQRMRRVNEAIREVLSDAISQDLKDPRIGFVTVTGVDTSPDLRQAKVYVSVLGKQKQKEATLKGLRSAEGYLQGVINDELHIKRTPTLEFVYDLTVDQGMRMATLIRHEEEELGIDLGEEPAEEDDSGAPSGEA